MTEVVGYQDLVRMLRLAAQRVREQEAELSRLDSFGGDGDHGVTMARAMGKLVETLDAASGEDVKTLLHDVGWAIMGVDGGATGPLFGSLFMAMSDEAPEAGDIDARCLSAMFTAGLAGVRKNTRAGVGDKTMIDALLPAVEALILAAETEGIHAALRAAAEAAEGGAATTVEFAARFGRAKNLGEQSKGAQDPGATSVSLIFRGLCEGMDERG